MGLLVVANTGPALRDTANEAGTWLELLVARLEDDGPALIADSGALSGVQLLDESGRIAARWASEGVPAGATVAALLPTSRHAIASMLAAFRTGRPFAPLNPRSARAELEPALRRLNPGVILHDGASAPLAQQLAALGGAITEDATAAGESGVSARPSRGRAVLIVHTSGTTGMPKAVELDDNLLGERQRVFGELMELTSSTRYFTTSPFHHMGSVGAMVAVLAAGGCLVAEPWDGLARWGALASVSPTHVMLVPTLIERLVAGGRLHEVVPDVISYGAAPLHPETLRRALQGLRHSRFIQLYGQTEGTPITVLSHADHLEALETAAERLGSVGRAAPGVELFIADPGPDGVGEVCARAAHLAVVDEYGVRRTGDLGRIDSDGYLYLRGRLSDLIIRGGENIHPLEIERCLERHTSVLEAAVIGVTDREFGQRVAAHVVLRPGTVATEDDLAAWCRRDLSSFKIPQTWIFVEQLPRNPLGKLLRRAL